MAGVNWTDSTIDAAGFQEIITDVIHTVATKPA